MSGVNPGNERLKRRYFHYLLNAQGLAEVTINHARLAIADYERFTEWRDFKALKERDAIGYRTGLLQGPSKRAAQLSSRATVHSKLTQVEKFFRWLSTQDGFRKAITRDVFECFGLSRRDRKIALQPRPKPTPSLEEVRRSILNMPQSTLIERRNRAMMALLLLTGSRISSLATLKLKHVHRNGNGITHDPAEMQVKGAKRFPTFFFPVGEDIAEIFRDYLDELRNELGWGSDDPLFPSTKQSVGHAHMFETVGLNRDHWRTADPIRAVCRAAFDAAGLPKYSPHSIRRTLVQLGERMCITPESFKVWSQNLGHEDVMTSFRSYGAFSELHQEELLTKMRSQPRESNCDPAHELPKLIEELRKFGFRRRDDGSDGLPPRSED